MVDVSRFQIDDTFGRNVQQNFRFVNDGIRAIECGTAAQRMRLEVQIASGRTGRRGMLPKWMPQLRLVKIRGGTFGLLRGRNRRWENNGENREKGARSDAATIYKI